MIDAILAGLEAGRVIPYLGHGMLGLLGENCPIPASADELAARLTARVGVPHKIRHQLTASAQFIENFKHRKTLIGLMTEAFTAEIPPTGLHRALASRWALPLIVHAWYDDLPQRALAERQDWGMVQGLSQAEHFGEWVQYRDHEGQLAEGSMAQGQLPAAWRTLLYQPLGSVAPACNFLVSDSDFVEVLTEIDIQTPIPEPVQRLRSGRGFLFLGCRFAHQLDRIFARQIMKRSSGRHWAVLPEQPTRNEARFLAEQNIERIDMPLEVFALALQKAAVPAAGRPAVTTAP